jgi:hypothetical protein
MIGGLWLFFTVVLLIFSLLTKQVPLFMGSLLAEPRGIPPSFKLKPRLLWRRNKNGGGGIQP